MKKGADFIIGLILTFCLFSFAGCNVSKKDVIGRYNFVGGWYGSADDNGGRIYISQK